MTDHKFNAAEARQYAERGAVEEWVHLFLTTVGDNQPLSDGLKMVKRYWVGPVLFPLEMLQRCTGPEPEMEYVDSVENWEAHIGYFQKLVREGWDMAPLIAQHVDGKLSIRDGNHRWEALKREGVERCWVIIWGDNSQEELEQFLKAHLSHR